jgi:RND family efflux transporter MFP subunit
MKKACGKSWRSCLAAVISVFILAACNEQEQAAEAPPRPIKTYTVTEAAGGMVRRFSGTSEASETTALSFPVPGTLMTISVNAGDSVAKDQLIAALDPEPLKLDVQAARADVEKAQSDVNAKKLELERNRELSEKGWVASAALEKHQAAFEAANSSLEYARSRMILAERNLGNATLRAPYAGTIASQPVERFKEVAVGQTIVELNSADGLVVSFSVPEASIRRIRIGQPVTVTFSALDDQRLDGRITEIANVASAGNAYKIKASLLSPPDLLRPGMTAEISIADASDGPDAGYFIPLSAIVPGDKDSLGAVFRFDAERGVVRRVLITPRGVRGNLVIVRDSLAPGDVIASAGVSFLMDGQSVRLLEE